MHRERIADRLNRLECATASPRRVDRAAFRLLTWSEIYYYYRREGGGQGRSARERTNYLSAMLAPASLAEAAICSATASHVEFVGETLKCRESPAKEPNGRKKGKCSLARDNRIMESAWRFFLVLPNELAR